MPRKNIGGKEGGTKSFSGLEQLFGSKSRFNLLKLFFRNPDKEFFVREMARLGNTQLNAIRREVQNLEELGIIQKAETSDSKKIFYRLNQKFILFSEVSALIKKAELLAEKKLVDRIKELGDIKLCILTGALLGTEAPTDLLLVGKINREALAKLISKFEKEINKSVTYTVLSIDEYKHRKSLTDKFLFSIIESKKIIAIDELEEFANDREVSTLF
ncbi:hypothetical protein L6259_01190 [Candidatus Parcubacteria bacterium]|nr:hypothetical protein [Patescibacteria group bacterium]MCG2693882.1 hypothetical protein [Candidatus Parcubacteria bacterium]